MGYNSGALDFGLVSKVEVTIGLPQNIELAIELVLPQKLLYLN